MSVLLYYVLFIAYIVCVYIEYINSVYSVYILYCLLNNILMSPFCLQLHKTWSDSGNLGTII